MQADQSRTALAQAKGRSQGGPTVISQMVFPHKASGTGRSGGARRDVPARRSGIANGVGLAHDAGNLLSALRLFAEVMSAPGVLSEQHRHLAGELNLLSDRSSVLLNRLVAATTGVSAENAEAEVPPEIDPLVLPESVLDCLGLLSKIAGRPVTFFCAPSAYAPVAVPREAFERMVVNLVKNAAEASPRGGTISVTLLATPSREREPHGMRMLLTVRDCGRGMSRSSVRQLFDPEPPPSGARHGLGFQIVRELAESTGGSVEVESELGAGTSVMLSWPVTRRPSWGGTVRAPSRRRTAHPVSTMTAGQNVRSEA